ncbi:hypothetical protein BH23VER1_BH23VER1_02170 [soil metagenome]
MPPSRGIGRFLLKKANGKANKFWTSAGIGLISEPFILSASNCIMRAGLAFAA